MEIIIKLKEINRFFRVGFIVVCSFSFTEHSDVYTFFNYSYLSSDFFSNVLKIVGIFLNYRVNISKK